MTSVAGRDEFGAEDLIAGEHVCCTAAIRACYSFKNLS
jgi:hypothetical protein